jgi:phosphohistidine phosphatase SixA
MKHLFVVRHGDYDGNYRISEKGRKQMETLGTAIKKVLNKGLTHLFSSTAPRALDSSQILAEQLGLPQFEQIPALWSGNDAPIGSYYLAPDKLIAFIDKERDKANGLIIVTHLEIIGDFPKYFLKKEFGEDKIIGEFDKGHAFHLDLERKAYQILPQ